MQHMKSHSTVLANHADRASGPAVLHVIVVGFHHKKGCQVEYSYPPLIKGNPLDSSELPEPWKHLPSLALPDGAHNFQEDTIYFHLPSLEFPRQTIYGISCYRQMNAEKLLKRSSDITRGTVQKSVCVLSQLPLYGLINAKLELITHAYFDERDFSKVSLLQETYQNLNSLLTQDMVFGMQAFLGLSVRDLILHFKHKALLLFKLLLLERKVLFYKAPVKDLCSTILILCSLFPGMLEKGMHEAATSINMQKLPSDLLVSSDQEYLVVHYDDGTAETSFIRDNGQKDRMPHSGKEKVEDWNSNLTFGSSGSDTSGVPSESMATSSSSDADNNNLSIFSETFVEQKEIVSESSEHGVEHHNPDEVDCNLPKTDNLDEEKHIFDSIHSEKVPDAVVTSRTTWHNDFICQRFIQMENVEAHKILPLLTDKETSQGNNCDLDDDEKLLNEIDELLDSDGKERLELSRSKLEFRNQDELSDSSSRGSLEIVENVSKIASLRNRISGTISSLTGRSFSTESQEDKEADVNNRYIHSVGEDDHTQLVRSRSPSVENFKIMDAELNIEKVQEPALNPLHLSLSDCSFPLPIFSKGSLCHPYLCLPFMDMLSNVNIRSFVVGATNILFKQKKHLFDVIVEIDEAKVDISDSELGKQLQLTTEDLRFADYLVRHVTEDTKDIFLNGTGWEGGDEWLRGQFKVYLLALLRTSLLEENSHQLEAFNTYFISAWKTTHNYKMWSGMKHPKVYNLRPGHPFQGQLSMADMKLKLSHSMLNSEKGRRLNQAMTNTGKAVVQTGKAVGGAFHTAKSMVSSWWSNLSSSSPVPPLKVDPANEQQPPP